MRSTEISEHQFHVICTTAAAPPHAPIRLCGHHPRLRYRGISPTKKGSSKVQSSLNAQHCKSLDSEISNVVATRLREFEGSSSTHHIVLAIRSSDDLKAHRHAVRRDARTNRCGRLSGQVERIG